MAGMCSSRFVEPPKAAMDDHRVADRSLGDDVLASSCPAGPAPCRAAALRRAMSSQIGWPEGARAEWGSARPKASPTTWALAAVPKKWHPPPGEAQVRQAATWASARLNLAAGEPGADRLHLARVLAVGRGQRDAAGDQHAGQSAEAGQGHHHRRQSLVAGGHAEHALGGGDRSGLAAKDGGRVVAVGEAVEHARRALRAAVARVGAIGGIGHAAGAAQFLGRRAQPPFPVRSGPCDSRERSACRLRPRNPPSVLRITNCGPARVDGSQPMPASSVMPKASPLGRRRSISGVSGN